MSPFIESQEWPSELEENIKKVSKKQFCLESEKCRSYEQVKNVAQCKANKIFKLLPENYQFFYVMTQYKSLNEEEYTKFVFAYKSKVQEKNFFKLKTTFIRICVPVNREKNSYIDDRCPFDECEDIQNPLLLQMNCKTPSQQ